MMRPVKFIANGKDDQVGSFEQVYMNIAIKPDEVELGVSTHVEHAPTNFLSILANLTPFSDFNQVIHKNAPCRLLLICCVESQKYLSVSGKLQYTRTITPA